MTTGALAFLGEPNAGQEKWKRWVLSQLSIVLQLCQMSNTLTIRLTEDLLTWLKETSRRTGVPVGRLIRQQLESARSQGGKQRFMRHAGAIKGGAGDVSSRKGFSHQ